MKERTYLIYGKRLQNNWANETGLVGRYPAMCQNEAVSMAMMDYSNNDIYDPASYFAMRED